MPDFDWKIDPIVDFIGHELVHAKSNLLDMFRGADCLIEQIDTDWNRAQLQLKLVIPQDAYRTIRDRRQKVEETIEDLARPAFAAFDDVDLRGVSIIPRVAADPTWRGGVEQPVTVTEKQEDAIWNRPGLLRLFLSHKSDQKEVLKSVKQQLLRYGIDSFLAHEEIRPTKPWAKVIQHGLQTCDALLAVGTNGFHSSAYCMQEVGWALGRGILVLPVLAGEAPEGFHNPDQGQTAVLTNASDSAKRIALALCEDARMKPRILDGIVKRLEGAPSGQDTWAIWQAFEDLWPCPESHYVAIIKAMEGNPEAMKSTRAVPRFQDWRARVVPKVQSMGSVAPAGPEIEPEEYDPFADE